jgi:hypothetical protein
MAIASAIADQNWADLACCASAALQLATVVTVTSGSNRAMAVRSASNRRLTSAVTAVNIAPGDAPSHQHRHPAQRGQFLGDPVAWSGIHQGLRPRLCQTAFLPAARRRPARSYQQVRRPESNGEPPSSANDLVGRGVSGTSASALMLAIAGFLPGDDPRMKATIDAT